MGKNSLIKSTDKKKGTSQKKKEAAGEKTTAKAAPKKSKTASQTKKKEAKTTPKKVTLSLKEILFKNFEWKYTAPQKQAPPSPTRPEIADPPPLVSAHDPAEAERIRKILSKKFDMEQIKEAARPPAEPAKVSQDQPTTATTAEPQTPVIENQETESEPVKQFRAENTAEIDYIPPEPTGKDVDPVQRYIKYLIAGAVVLVLLLIGASWKNSTRFYIEPKADAIEIWRGRFSPLGKRIEITLDNIQYTEPVRPVYTREEVYPLIFNYYLSKADALLEVSGLPDFETIKSYLNQAKNYAVFPELSSAVRTRLNNIERMTLLYKVDVAISQGTPEALQTASALLKKAEPLADDAVQAELIIRKKEEIAQRKAALEAQETEAQSANE